MWYGWVNIFILCTIVISVKINKKKLCNFVLIRVRMKEKYINKDINMISSYTCNYEENLASM
jgi:hypothetical protein